MTTEAVENLVGTLLYEGYALYPYTQGVKNSTPTPFGIVYPPSYAEAQPAAFRVLRLEAVLKGGPEAKLSGSVRFLQAAGSGHKGIERRLDLGPATLADLARTPVDAEISYEAEGDEPRPPLRGRVRMRAELLGPDLARVKLCIHNDTEMLIDPAEATRNEALHHSLLSTLPLLEATDGTFVSPLEREGEAGAAVEENDAVNTYPVLVGPDDSAVLGAAFMLPDHPELAPESLGNLFDNTEIEEALLLHVQTLTDDERSEIEGGDSAVREMIERAEKVTSDEMLGLHGRLTYSEPAEEGVEPGGAAMDGGPRQPPAGIDVTPGEVETEFEGVRIQRGDKVVLKPGTEGDVYDKMLHGRTATVERIYTGYDERVYLGVTIDDDPGQELLRETGRYLFFFGDEVEVPANSESEASR